MRNNYPYLKDSSFLKSFDSIRNKEQYVKITVLNFEEKPIQAIEGRVTGGTLNLDGNSSVRRTCNLSMVATDYENDLTVDNKLKRAFITGVKYDLYDKDFGEKSVILFPDKIKGYITIVV